MTQSELRELKAIGAELGAAKAEVERLRGLLHGAHDTIRDLAEDLDEEEFQATIDQLAEIELALAPQQAEPDHDCNYRTGGVICKVCDLNVIKQAEDTDTFTAVDMATAAAQEFRDGQAAVEPASAQDEREAFVAWATRLYNTGYLAGHHDTVEAGYTHVYQQDMDSYHEEVVEEWLTDNPQPASLTRPAQAEPAPAQDERECCCPKIGEPWNPEKHGRDCPAHQAKRSAQTAPAQDDREAPQVRGTLLVADPSDRKRDTTVVLTRHQAGAIVGGRRAEPLMTVAQHERIVAALTRPAQTEQRPVAWRLSLPDGRTTLEAAYPSWADGGDGYSIQPLYAAPIAQTAPQGKFRMGDLVKKSTGSEWQGRICGTYSTTLTPEGYAVESEAHAGSVQIYPAKALEAVDE